MQDTRFFPGENRLLPLRQPMRLPLTLVATAALAFLGIALLSPFLRPPSDDGSASGLMQQNQAASPTFVPTASATPLPTLVPPESPMGASLMAYAQTEVPIYAAASADSQVLGVLNAGDLVEAFGTDVTGQWLAVLWQGQIVGWVSVPSVELLNRQTFANQAPDPLMMTATATPIPVTARPAFVWPSEAMPSATTSQAVTVYALPDDTSEALGTLEADAPVVYIGRDQTGEWTVIRWQDDIVGWVLAEALIFAEISQPPVIASLVPTVIPPTAPPPVGTATPIP